MALIRNFPVPSDRMAIISTLLNIEDAVVLEYGPEGTTHFSMNFFNKLGQDYPNRLFTTDDRGYRRSQHKNSLRRI